MSIANEQDAFTDVFGCGRGGGTKAFSLDHLKEQIQEGRLLQSLIAIHDDWIQSEDDVQKMALYNSIITTWTEQISQDQRPKIHSSMRASGVITALAETICYEASTNSVHLHAPADFRHSGQLREIVPICRSGQVNAAAYSHLETISPGMWSTSQQCPTCKLYENAFPETKDASGDKRILPERWEVIATARTNSIITNTLQHARTNPDENRWLDGSENEVIRHLSSQWTGEYLSVLAEYIRMERVPLLLLTYLEKYKQKNYTETAGAPIEELMAPYWKRLVPFWHALHEKLPHSSYNSIFKLYFTSSIERMIACQTEQGARSWSFDYWLDDLLQANSGNAR